MLFGLVFELSFHNSKLKKNELELWELKTNFRSFQISKIEIQGILVNIWWLWDPPMCSNSFFFFTFSLHRKYLKIAFSSSRMVGLWVVGGGRGRKWEEKGFNVSGFMKEKRKKKMKEMEERDMLPFWSAQHMGSTTLSKFWVKLT